MRPIIYGRSASADAFPAVRRAMRMDFLHAEGENPSPCKENEVRMKWYPVIRFDYISENGIRYEIMVITLCVALYMRYNR